jgi:hypothetical protein
LFRSRADSLGPDPSAMSVARVAPHPNLPQRTLSSCARSPPIITRQGPRTVPTGQHPPPQPLAQVKRDLFIPAINMFNEILPKGTDRIVTGKPPCRDHGLNEQVRCTTECRTGIGGGGVRRDVADAGGWMSAAWWPGGGPVGTASHHVPRPGAGSLLGPRWPDGVDGGGRGPRCVFE